MAINKQNNSHTTPPQTHIAFIIPCPKAIDSCHKSWPGNNHGRHRTNPCDNRWFNCKVSHSNYNKFSSLLITVPPPLNSSVINPPNLSSVFQQSSRSSQNNPCDNQCFNSKDSNSKSNELSSPVMPVTTPLNDSVINPPQLSLFVNIHPALHRTQRQSRNLLQYLVRLLLIHKIPCHRCPPRMEVTIFMDAWLMCLSQWFHDDNSIL